MVDETEIPRKLAVGVIRERARLETLHGQVWDTQELQVDFTVQGFAAPFVMCVNKEIGKRGSLMFQHRPRFYFDWTEERR